MAVIGVDEAGRGPLAGQVVAAAVVLCEGGIAGLDDSKKLSATRRAALEEQIKARCRWAIGEASVAEIDALNILQATMLAMTRAVEGLLNQPMACHAELVSTSMAHALPPETVLVGGVDPWTLKQVQGDEVLVLVDGNRLPDWPYRSRAIIGGDALEPCISAASIIAKEHRDRLMEEADKRWPAYGFAQHKGYGSVRHRDAIATHGPCPIHRMSFSPMKQLRLPV